MKRISGQPQSKQKYLSRLDEKQFPFLIADILYFVYYHSDIRILDGPGDGKRDIISKNGEGKICITQCKFHKDFSKSVSSRETDEIAIALLKFKTNNGIFATTGKLSPQAKREFLSDFPDYELSFLEGVEIVDIVLSNPILTSVWINNESIELTSKTLAFPFILRDIIKDKPAAELDLVNLPSNIKIESGFISKDYFHPYRSPIIPTIKESGTFFSCYNIVYTGPYHIHELSNLAEDLLAKLGPCIYKQYDVVALRIGVPYLAERIDGELKSRLKLDIEPKTFIFKEGKRFTEKEFTIPISDTRFLFPRRFGHLESQWAAWFCPTLNLCLQAESFQPFDVQSDFFSFNMQNIHLQKLNESLFFSVTKNQKDMLESILNKKELPDWSCEYGFDGYIIGWRHPFLLDDSVLKSFNLKDDIINLIENESQNKKFRKSIENIKSKLLKSGFKICTPNKAISISADSSEPLFIEPTWNAHDSAYLFHFFKDIPSPISLKKRTYNFTGIWDVPSFEFGSETVNFVNQQKIDSHLNFKLSFDIKTTQRRTNRWARLDLWCNVPENMAAIEFLDKRLPEVKSIIKRIERKLKSKHPDAILKTEDYWKQEIGMYFRM